MKNDKLTRIWNSQKKDSPLSDPELVIRKANKQRSGQFASIAIMSITVLVLVIYAAYYTGSQWNNFSLGLLLMISSLAFRIILEFVSLYRKESRLVTMDNISFQKYLKKHYKLRLKVNYIITPICFAIYLYGFLKLLPYFKREFSEYFYTYILVSGFVSLLILAIIIVQSIVKECNFLQQLNRK
jgi:hypothetical protein